MRDQNAPLEVQVAKLEASLQASEARFRLLVESVRDYAIFLLDPQGNIASWNVGAERIKGYSAAEVIDRHFSIFYPREDVQSGKCELELATAAREGRFEDEGWRIRKNGERFWANVVITALRHDGALIGFAKVTRDLTDRRRAEEARLTLAEETAARQAAERQAALLMRLQHLTGRIAGVHTPDEVARILVDEGSRAVDATVTLLFRPRGDRLELVRSRGASAPLIGALHGLAPGAAAPHVNAYRSREAEWVETPDEYVRRYPALAEVARPSGSAFALPLAFADRVVGVLGFRFGDTRSFKDDERALMNSWAAYAAQAIDRADVYAREIAARELAEGLQVSLSTTLRSIGDAVITTDGAGAITMMNPIAERLTAWRESEAKGRPLTEIFRIVNEHTRAPVPDPVTKVLELGVVVGLANHTILIARDGTEIPIDDSGAPIRRRDGAEIEGVVLVFRDVTEKKAEESRAAFLANATAVLAESLDYEVTLGKVARLAVPGLADWCAVDLVQERDHQRRRVAVQHVDPARVKLAEELATKYPPRPDAPTGVPNVLRTGRSELYATISDDLLAASCVDEDHLRLARELSLRSAMIVPLLARGRVLGAITFVFAESGRVYTEADVRFAEELARRSAIAIDNARLYASEQSARKSADVANRAKDEFLAVVSHELRTPLNAIMGWSKMILSANFDEGRRARGLETIERNAVAMAQLIEDILDMSRVISGKMRLEVHPVRLDRVVEAAIDSIKPAAEAKQLHVRAKIDEDLPAIVGDATRLQQVVWNLLSNAVKFTSRGGVGIHLRRNGSLVEVAVTDTGKGIAPEFLPHVFEPFRQEDASYKRSRGGLGLGLAITRQLVELHGGRIEAYSAGEGQGAKFTVSFPVSAVSRSEEVPRTAGRRFQLAPALVPPPELKGLRLLVVDDDPDARLLVKEILEDCGCRVEVAASADEAFAALTREIPDVLISDVGMPERDGYDLMRQVRALPPERGGDVPAAALTAYTSGDDRRRLLNAGYSMHVPKPVEPAELVTIVATLSRFVHRSRSSSRTPS